MSKGLRREDGNESRAFFEGHDGKKTLLLTRVHEKAKIARPVLK